jgi:hypothetical protein
MAKAAAGAQAASSKPDVADQLTKLADLRDRGVLSDAEFEAQKGKILETGWPSRTPNLAADRVAVDSSRAA